MKIDVLKLPSGKDGTVELLDSVFGLKPRKDILHRVVLWQLAKRQQGSHSVLTRSESSYSTKKIYRQKGTGGARHGSRRSPIFRKGGVYKGPTPRSHAHNLNKKIRCLGLKHALSSKLESGDLVVIDKSEIKDAKTKALRKNIKHFGKKRLLIIDGPELDRNFSIAARNIPNIDVLPSIGANVYDILRKDILVLTKSGVKALQERLGEANVR